MPNKVLDKLQSIYTTDYAIKSCSLKENLKNEEMLSIILCEKKLKMYGILHFYTQLEGKKTRRIHRNGLG